MAESTAIITSLLVRDQIEDRIRLNANRFRFIAATLHHSYQDKIALREAILEVDAAIREYYISSKRLKIKRLSRETLTLEDYYINLALINMSEEM